MKKWAIGFDLVTKSWSDLDGCASINRATNDLYEVAARTLDQAILSAQKQHVDQRMTLPQHLFVASLFNDMEKEENLLAMSVEVNDPQERRLAFNLVKKGLLTTDDATTDRHVEVKLTFAALNARPRDPSVLLAARRAHRAHPLPVSTDTPRRRLRS